MSPLDRLMLRAAVQDNGCWHWIGHVNVCGYGGAISMGDGTRQSPHRAMWLLTQGPIPAGHQVDHLCHDPDLCRPTTPAACLHRRCVNPAHLQAVTVRENVVRSNNRAGRALRENVCPRGHEYRQTTTQRYCPTCNNESGRRRYHADDGTRKARRNARLRARYAERKAAS